MEATTEPGSSDTPATASVLSISNCIGGMIQPSSTNPYGIRDGAIVGGEGGRA